MPVYMIPLYLVSADSAESTVKFWEICEQSRYWTSQMILALIMEPASCFYLTERKFSLNTSL